MKYSLWQILLRWMPGSARKKQLTKWQTSVADIDNGASSWNLNTTLATFKDPIYINSCQIKPNQKLTQTKPLYIIWFL